MFRGGRRRDGRRITRADHPALRPDGEIRAQLDAARAFAGDVTSMMPMSHQYTAGQAAALSWLLGLGPLPLTFRTAGSEVPSPEAVARLSRRARGLMTGRQDGRLFPQAYVVGVDYVCHWVQRRTDVAPIPGQGPPAPPRRTPPRKDPP